MTKRDDIRQAALELFSERGIEATTTREIAERAGTAEGTLYRHFEGKEDLARWLFEQYTGQLHEILLNAVAETSEPRAKLQAMVRGVFNFFSLKPASCTYLLSNRNSEVAHSLADELSPPMQLFVETLEQGIERGLFQDDPPHLLAGWILALVQRSVLFLKQDRVALSPQDAADQTVRAVLRLTEREDAST